MNTSTKYSAEVRERGVRMVRVNADEHASQCAAIEPIAGALAVVRSSCIASAYHTTIGMRRRDRPQWRPG